MTRVLFVHGIAQEGRSSEKLRAEWLKALSKGLQKSGLAPIASMVMVPFYGDKLAAQTNNALKKYVPFDNRDRGVHPDDLKRSEPNLFTSDTDFSKFALEFASDALAKRPAVAASALASGLESRVANGDMEKRDLQNWPPIIAAVRALERLMPSVGDAFIEMFLKTTHCYLTVDDAFNETNKIVSDELVSSKEPTVVVGHSLGSVVTYHVLHSNSEIDIPLYITLGSPLAISAVRNRLRKPPSIPTRVTRWHNAFDLQDVVALNPLDKQHFLKRGQIENVSSIENGTKNHHGIAGYLSDAHIAKLIRSAIK